MRTRECESIGSSGGAIRGFKATYFAASIDPATSSSPDPMEIGCWTFYIGKDGRIVDVDKRVRSASHGLDVAANLTGLGTERQA